MPGSDHNNNPLNEFRLSAHLANKLKNWQHHNNPLHPDGTDCRQTWDDESYCTTDDTLSSYRTTYDSTTDRTTDRSSGGSFGCAYDPESDGDGDVAGRDSSYSVMRDARLSVPGHDFQWSVPVHDVQSSMPEEEDRLRQVASWRQAQRQVARAMGRESLG